ncbi:MAG: GNAT family N-acetyltransferase, partial [Beijerinckiaceae bacterium]
CFDSLHTARDLWLKLETQGECTPYQTFTWSDAWMRTIGEAEGWRAWSIVITNPAGDPLALLPLAIRRSKGVTIASFIGGKHANYTMPLYARGARAGLTADALAALLAGAAKRDGVDLIGLERQLTFWAGAPNPLARVQARPAASHAYKTALLADGEAFMRAAMSSESRKKLRHKEKKLADFGTVTFREAASESERSTVLDAFLAQKAMRFAALGIVNPFVEPPTIAFLRQAAIAGSMPPIRLFALFAGERVLSVFGGVIHAGRFTGMFTSFDPDLAVSRYSPGDLLLYRLIQEMCARGLDCFDLGTGEASYKGDYCREIEELADGLIPATIKGRAAALACSAAAHLKRRLKGDSRAMAFVAGLRRRLAGVRA